MLWPSVGMQIIEFRPLILLVVATRICKNRKDVYGTVGFSEIVSQAVRAQNQPFAIRNLIINEAKSVSSASSSKSTIFNKEPY